MRNAMILTVTVFTFLLASCGRSGITARLSDIESYIDSRPDSALAAIRQIDTAALRGRAAKAKYALLHAIALDKNYIDTADTRIVQPAVDYYDRHGSPEERLKAYMYLGTEQYNAGHYNQAIVSFNKADEYASKIEDNDLLGILYSKIAETFTNTQDFVQANDYIDKSIICFDLAGRSDKKNLVRIIKAKNLSQLMEWDQADSLFQELLRDSTLTDEQIGSTEGYYGLAILYNPFKKDTSAFQHLKKAISINGSLEDLDQVFAYAYLLRCLGKNEESETIFSSIDTSSTDARFAYDYWAHRVHKDNNDFRNAYYSLWSAKHLLDSVYLKKYKASATNAHIRYQNNKAYGFASKLKKHKIAEISGAIILTLSIVLALILIVSWKRRFIEKQGRKEIIIDTLTEEIETLKNSNRQLLKDKGKARFAVLGELYEDFYHLRENGQSLSADALYKIINEKIAVLNKNIKAKEQFERILNNESNGIMASFRSDYPGLTPDEYWLAGLVFAGFDTTEIMLIMGLTTLEYTRVKKNRLKGKILKQAHKNEAAYLLYF